MVDTPWGCATILGYEKEPYDSDKKKREKKARFSRPHENA
jgi:hypothetical protein